MLEWHFTKSEPIILGTDRWHAARAYRDSWPFKRNSEHVVNNIRNSTQICNNFTKTSLSLTDKDKFTYWTHLEFKIFACQKQINMVTVLAKSLHQQKMTNTNQQEKKKCKQQSSYNPMSLHPDIKLPLYLLCYLLEIWGLNWTPPSD